MPAGPATPPMRQFVGKVLSDRLAVTAVLSGALVAAGGALRKSEVTGVHPDDFATMRSGWRGCADVVFAGDSRILCAAAPSAMGDALPGLRILNFAYAGNTHAPAYLRAVERVLDPAGDTRIIVLGISPASLTGRSDNANRFVQDTRHLAERPFLSAHLAPLIRFFEPMTTRDLLRRLAPGMVRKHYYRHFHRDGWLACRQIPETPRRALVHYRETFRNRRVSPHSVAFVLDFVRRWTRSGIRVYALRPPTTAAMVELEGRLSGFDEEAFKAGLEAAGGVWLDVVGGEYDKYDSYDGSHLGRDAALRFSRDLAQAICRSLAAAQEPGSRPAGADGLGRDRPGPALSAPAMSG